ncbi:MAG: hypothetical protein A2X34_09505 [Elusimicrobia bacterium GWC2_51_8]|nr:MAG: hypothetical protein A2X34_09505 [Elusimicrobia bacterium GWC2_51_8]HAF95058.1 hypothetical protein [Elusimicrobiota bacterium]HCE98719.1 hypothetical protein [Elusimicrobiota bacterium]
MDQIKNNFIAFAFLGLSAAFLCGCVTSRTASYPNRKYDTVFKSAVSGLCSEKKLLVYEADKAKGIIRVQGRGIFSMPPDTPVVIAGANGGTPTASVTIQGMNNPWPDRMLGLISDNLPAAKAEPAVSKTSGTEPDMDLERQKLDLEKEKLQFEREKLEFEKQKQKGQ